MNTIERVKKDNLCVGCGMCGAICPKKAISYIRNRKGVYSPTIDENKCIKCGLCFNVCPGLGIETKYDIDSNEGKEKILKGEVLESFVATTKDVELLENAVSGGAVTTIIKELLSKKKYDCAFLIKGYNYDRQVEAEKIQDINELDKTPGSRYLPVSQMQTAEYIINNPDKKVIIVATPCNVLGLLNVIKLKNLKRENYLFIGLFCDKVMTYNVLDYFKEHPKTNKREAEEFYFRTKKNSKWPGDVSITFSNKTSIMLDKMERMKVKQYFNMERCMYCLDKLNHLADISVGDNYSNIKLPYNGSNSILVRTAIGMEVWNDVKNLFYYEKCDATEIFDSQQVEKKYKNISNIVIKKSDIMKYNISDKYTVSKEDIENYNNLLNKMELGSNKKNKKIYKKTHSKIRSLIGKVISKLK